MSCSTLFIEFRSSTVSFRFAGWKLRADGVEVGAGSGESVAICASGEGVTVGKIAFAVGTDVVVAVKPEVAGLVELAVGSTAVVAVI